MMVFKAKTDLAAEFDKRVAQDQTKVPATETDTAYLFYGYPPSFPVLDGGERISVDLPAFFDTAKQL